MRTPISHFTTLRLRQHDPASWAVVSVPAGAIVTDDDGKLVMRLTKAEAEQIVEDMTAKKLSSDQAKKPDV